VEEEEVKEEPKNMVVSMNERFSRPETDIQPMYDKLHDEVLAFRASVHVDPRRAEAAAGGNHSESCTGDKEDLGGVRNQHIRQSRHASLPPLV